MRPFLTLGRARQGAGASAPGCANQGGSEAPLGRARMQDGSGAACENHRHGGRGQAITPHGYPITATPQVPDIA